MADEHGHIKLSRKFFQEDPFWNEDREFTRAEAWIDLIRTATWKRRRSKVVDGDVVTLRRGQLLASERFLAQRWNWSRGKVRRYLGKLVDMDRIKAEKDHPAAHLGARITLVNYSRYQSPYSSSVPPTGPPADQGRTKENTREERDTTFGAYAPHSVSRKKDSRGTTGWPTPSELEMAGGEYIYPTGFEAIWSDYPDRDGTDPKKAAYRKARARVNDEVPLQDLHEATRLYADRVQSEGIAGTRYVMQAKKFFGPDDHWREELEREEKTPEDDVIRDDEEFERFYGATA